MAGRNIPLRGIGSIIAVLMVVLCTPPAHAEDAYEADVRRQLLQAAITLFGTAEATDMYIDRINRGYYHEVPLQLLGQRNYAIIAVCDRDCYDIDLELYDNRQRFVDEDKGIEDSAVVFVRPSYRSTYNVRVFIPGCRARRCTYGIGVFVAN